MSSTVCMWDGYAWRRASQSAIVTSSKYIVLLYACVDVHCTLPVYTYNALLRLDCRFAGSFCIFHGAGKSWYMWWYDHWCIVSSKTTVHHTHVFMCVKQCALKAPCMKDYSTPAQCQHANYFIMTCHVRCTQAACLVSALTTHTSAAASATDGTCTRHMHYPSWWCYYQWHRQLRLWQYNHASMDAARGVLNSCSTLYVCIIAWSYAYLWLQLAVVVSGIDAPADCSHKQAIFVSHQYVVPVCIAVITCRSRNWQSAYCLYIVTCDTDM